MCLNICGRLNKRTVFSDQNLLAGYRFNIFTISIWIKRQDTYHMLCTGVHLYLGLYVGYVCMKFSDIDESFTLFFLK